MGGGKRGGTFSEQEVLHVGGREGVIGGDRRRIILNVRTTEVTETREEVNSRKGIQEREKGGRDGGKQGKEEESTDTSCPWAAQRQTLEAPCRANREDAGQTAQHLQGGDKLKGG